MERRVDADTSLMGSESSSLLLLGEEFDIDLASREMQWSVRIPMGTRQGQPLLSGSKAFVYGSKGLVGVDLSSGKVETFAGYEKATGTAEPCCESAIV